MATLQHARQTSMLMQHTSQHFPQPESLLAASKAPGIVQPP